MINFKDNLCLYGLSVFLRGGKGRVFASNVIEFDGVGLRYGPGPEILKDITFALPSGSFYFLTGESGAGKTSLLSLMYLSRMPTRGHIRIFGKSVQNAKRDALPEMRNKIGVVFQDFRLLDHLSALDNVALPLRIAGFAESEVQKRVTDLLTWTGLASHLNAKPPTLSGGQKQSVAIARAVINRPQILVADEPTGNMDDKTAARLLRLFIELNRRGTTVIIATHNESLIRAFPYPRMHLSNGRLSLHPAGYAPAPAYIQREERRV